MDTLWRQPPRKTPAAAQAPVAIATGAGVAVLALLCAHAGAQALLLALAGLTALIAAGALLLAPAHFVLGLFTAVLVGGHLYRSPLVLPFAGVEWHPRELLLLFVLLYFMLHAGVHVLRKLRPNRWPAFSALEPRFHWREDPLHAVMLLYLLLFVYLALSGLAQGHAIVSESRYPLFLASYFAFVFGLRGKRELYLLLWIAAVTAGVGAAAGLAYFVFTLLTGIPDSFLNAWGYFVQRRVAGVLLLSVRPAAHAFFEAAIPVLLGVLLWRVGSPRTRRWCLALLLLFLCAIAITAMRTAYLTVAFTCLLVLFLRLPRPLRGILGWSGACALPVLLATVWFYFRETLSPQELGVSLRARFEESFSAWEMFLAHPVFGAGMGSGFEAMNYAAHTSELSYGRTTLHTLHNYWLYLLFKGGLVAFVLTCLVFGGIFARGALAVRRLGHSLEGVVLQGLLIALLGQCLASIAMARLYYPAGHVLVAFTAAAIVLLAADTTPGGPGRPPTARLRGSSASGSPRISNSAGQ